jgi:hypothetical protein
MNSFHEFLDTKKVSKEGQIAQYSRSLKNLLKTKVRLSSMGMNIKDIDNQVDTVDQALQRRLSGKEKWYGDIIRIDQEPIGGTPMWKLTTRSDLFFHIPTSDTTGVIKIPLNWQQYPNPKKPMTKFIEYRDQMFGYNKVNLITYSENRTVDIVPIRTQKEKAQYYLIRRQDSGFWATVGGHIDEGELQTPILAARRELKEETIGGSAQTVDLLISRNEHSYSEATAFATGSAALPTAPRANGPAKRKSA